jgi:predicted DNA-binding helix-hairpin-helix protein
MGPQFQAILIGKIIIKLRNIINHEIIYMVAMGESNLSQLDCRKPGLQPKPSVKRKLQLRRLQALQRLHLSSLAVEVVRASSLQFVDLTSWYSWKSRG